MPLSDDEQRILSQIEQQLHETDPALAKEVATTTVYTHSARNIKWSVLGFIIGLVTKALPLWLLPNTRQVSLGSMIQIVGFCHSSRFAS